ncbi:hypothetical protein M434DRAFT_30029 [Hypoxylon sp. CO27-5]|nr:hypothetical protein M434DRAFT_30029 [Hypoxylon sp. CO27-5]
MAPWALRSFNFVIYVMVPLSFVAELLCRTGIQLMINDFGAALTSLLRRARGIKDAGPRALTHTETSPSLSGGQPSALCILIIRDIHLPRGLDELYIA